MDLKMDLFINQLIYYNLKKTKALMMSLVRNQRESLILNLSYYMLLSYIA